MNAVITGATQGIGRAIAIKLAQHGYNIAICARNKSSLEKFSRELLNMGVKVISSVTDCSDKQQLIHFFDFVKNEMPTIDILVNNAGTFIPGNILDEADSAFEQQQLLNINAGYYLGKYFGRLMRQAQSGHIFNICSIASMQVIANAGSYSVTKAAMLSLTHVLRKELAAYNVKVTAILPGSTLTASWDGTEIPEELFVKPEDIANSLYSILNLSSGANVDELVLTPLNFDK